MLVLSRRVDERIQIGDDIQITIVRLENGRVKIGIDAPPHVSIRRSELATLPCDASSPELQTSFAVVTAD